MWRDAFSVSQAAISHAQHDLLHSFSWSESLEASIVGVEFASFVFAFGVLGWRIGAVRLLVRHPEARSLRCRLQSHDWQMTAPSVDVNLQRERALSFESVAFGIRSQPSRIP